LTSSLLAAYGIQIQNHGFLEKLLQYGMQSTGFRDEYFLNTNNSHTKLGMLIDIEADDSKNLYFHLFCQMNFKVRIYFSDNRHIASGRSWSGIARNVQVMSLFYSSAHSHKFIHELSLCRSNKDNSSSTPVTDFLPSVTTISNKLHIQNSTPDLATWGT